MERNENMCLESPSSLTENNCTSTSLHRQVSTVFQISTRATFHFLFCSVVSAHGPFMLSSNKLHIRILGC